MLISHSETIGVMGATRNFAGMHMPQAVPCKLVQQYAATKLNAAGVENPMLDARLLLQHALDCAHEDLVRDADRQLSVDEQVRYHQLVARRCAREPLSHITGKRAFWKDEFLVSSDVLDPRPDSETLIEVLLMRRSDRKAPLVILDFGTGSGCLLLSLLREYEQAHGTGIDKSKAALEMAQRNAKALKLDDRSNFIESNWGETLQSHYDMIVSNPPYIAEHDCLTLAPEVKDYEPMLALSGGADGLACYRVLMPHIARCLKRDGIAAVELGAGQNHAVTEIANAAGLKVSEVIADFGGINRVLVLNHLR